MAVAIFAFFIFMPKIVKFIKKDDLFFTFFLKCDRKLCRINLYIYRYAFYE